MITNNRNAAIFASLLYSFTPVSTILSVAGSDGLFALIIAFALIFIFDYQGSIKKINIFVSGLLFGLAGGISFAVWGIVPFVFVALLCQIIKNNNWNKKIVLEYSLYSFLF